MNYFIITACLIIAFTCTVGVFTPKFDDTLLQRIALTGCVLSSLGLAFQLYKCQSLPQSMDLFILSVAIWCSTTFWKFRK